MKRKIISFERIFRYGLDNFSRNTWLTTAATAVMTMTLLVIMTTFIASLVFDDTIAQVRQKIDVSVYLRDDVTPTQRDTFRKEIENVDVVTEVQYISKEQARKAFQDQNKKELEQLEALGELGSNPFPASLRIKTSDPNKLDALNKVIVSPKNAALQSEPPSNSGERKAAIENIARISQFSETAGLVASGVFIVISVMIIFNTIRMAIFNRKDEIQMMKLIGADKGFIRGPFIVEAALYGMLAAAVSILLIYLVLLTQARYLEGYEIVVEPTLQLFRAWSPLVIVAQIVIGVLIGIFSSFLAIRRYLKV